MNRLLELQQQLADSAARSDIEAYCKPAGCPGSLWYFDRSHEREYSSFVEKAIEYLTLRGRIARHPDHADWVRVNFDAEVVKEYALSAVRENVSNIHDVAKMYASALRNRVAIYGPKNTKHNQVFLDVASFLDRLSELNAVPDSEGGSDGR